MVWSKHETQGTGPTKHIDIHKAKWPEVDYGSGAKNLDWGKATLYKTWIEISIRQSVEKSMKWNVEYFSLPRRLEVNVFQYQVYIIWN